MERGGGGNPFLDPRIFSNIFNRLKSVKTQKQFRLVNTVWEEASVSQWRKSALIKIDVPYSPKNVLSYLSWFGKGVEEFIKLWKESSDPTDAAAQTHPHPFSKQPFCRFNLCFPQDKIDNDDELRTNSSLREFWELCSPQMEYLQLSHFNSNECFIPTMKWLLLEGAGSDLKELKLKDCSFLQWKAPRKIKATKRKRKGALETAGPSAPEINLTRTSAEALTTLSMNLTCNLVEIREFQEVFQIIPNLKALSSSPYRTSDHVMEALAASTETMTNKIKLEVLDVEPMEVDSFGALVKYLKASKAEMKEVTLSFIFAESLLDPIKRIHRPPYHFHQFLDYCSSTLKKLTITYKGPQSGGAGIWITDFNGRLFPHLTELNITVAEWPGEGRYGETKFDFRGLCGMQSLKRFVFEKLSTLLGGDKSHHKKEISEEDLSYDGITEWMRDKILDQDLSSLHLDHLEEFTFQMYCSLGVESLRKVGSWMKNLKKAKLLLNNETFPVIKEVWPNLEKLTLLRQSKVDEEIILRERIVNENGPIRIWIQRSDYVNEYDSDSSNGSLFTSSSEGDSDSDSSSSISSISSSSSLSE